MSLEMLTITFETNSKGVFTGSLKALFNPNQLKFSRTVNWAQVIPAGTTKNAASRLNFQHAAAETLTVSLFFDTYGGDPHKDVGFFNTVFGFASRPQSVLPLTNKVKALASYARELDRPPICRLSWGSNRSIFQGVLTSLASTFTMFLDDGTPVRATVDCTFMEAARVGRKGTRTELHSPDVDKQHMVQPGDNLMALAAFYYGDTTRWRVIAEHNGLDDPRRLQPGRMLAIPKIA